MVCFFLTFFMFSKCPKTGKNGRKRDVSKLAVQFFAKKRILMLSFQNENNRVICFPKAYYDCFNADSISRNWWLFFFAMNCYLNSIP